MNNSFKNIIALLFSVCAAAIVTFAIIILGHSIIPSPIGIDTNDFESIKSNFHLFKFRHFIFPLLAHAIGTFVAAYLVSRFAASYKFWLALAIGVIFTFASLSLSLRIGHFNWIGIVEIGQYIPVSILGYKFWQLNSSKTPIVDVCNIDAIHS